MVEAFRVWGEDDSTRPERGANSDEHVEAIRALPVRWGLGDFAHLLTVFAAVVAVMVVLPFEINNTAFGLILQTATIAPVVYATYRKGQKSLRLDFGFQAPTLAEFAMGVGIGVGLLITTGIGNAILTAAFGEIPSNNTLITDPPENATVKAFELFAIAVMAPLSEELLFRGLFLRSAVRRFSPAFAVFLTSVVFSGVHALGMGANGWTLALALYPLSLTMTWLTLRRGHIGLSLVIHATFNGLVALISLTT